MNWFLFSLVQGGEADAGMFPTANIDREEDEYEYDYLSDDESEERVGNESLNVTTSTRRILRGNGLA